MIDASGPVIIQVEESEPHEDPRLFSLGLTVPAANPEVWTLPASGLAGMIAAHGSVLAAFTSEYGDLILRDEQVGGAVRWVFRKTDTSKDWLVPRVRQFDIMVAPDTGVHAGHIVARKGTEKPRGFVMTIRVSRHTTGPGGYRECEPRVIADVQWTRRGRTHTSHVQAKDLVVLGTHPVAQNGTSSC